MCNSLGVMRRIRQYVPKKSLITIYNTMILPHIDYAIIIWSNCSDAALSKVQKLQNAAMRIILGVPFRTHTNDMLKELSFMDVRSRISYATGCMMFKVLHDMTPYYLSNFRAITDVHSINTRQSKAGNLYQSAIYIMVKRLLITKVVFYGTLCHEISEMQKVLCLLKLCLKMI